MPFIGNTDEIFMLPDRRFISCMILDIKLSLCHILALWESHKYFLLTQVVWFCVMKLTAHFQGTFLPSSISSLTLRASLINQLLSHPQRGIMNGMCNFWLVGLLISWVLWHINLCRLFNAKSIFIQITSSISNNSV